jgi:hypothetical protein
MQKNFAIGTNCMVFGSNTQGRHGKGAALYARQHHGAVYGVAEGRTGNAYAIITKELRRGYPPVTLDEVRVGVERFLVYAREHPELEFQVTRIGCGLAGFREEDIKGLFADAPTNCQLPEGWRGTAKTYAGIGARDTPQEVLDLMTRYAGWAAKEGHVLRSGGAHGADEAFMKGAGEACEVYLPWRGYNGHEGHVVTSEAVQLASEYHPGWERCSQGVRKLHGRNMHILMGPALDKPVGYVVCWTPGGRVQGGTGQALRAAADLGVPVCNLGRWTGLDEMRRGLYAFIQGLS